MARYFPHLVNFVESICLFLKHYVILRRLLKVYILSELFRHQVWSVRVSNVILVHIINMKVPRLSVTI